MKVVLKFLVLILIISYVLTKIYSDIQTNTYKDKKAVLNDNAIQRGWIPQILPDSAFQIIETHNLDTNKVNGSFQYREKDENTFMNKLENLNGQYTWEEFQFTIDKTNNKVEFKDVKKSK